MTEHVDLDALELRAMRFQKLNPLHECFDSTTVLALIAELRQERERADELQNAYFTASRALSRAEETIEKVRNLPRHELNALATVVDAHDIDAALTGYDDQKGQADD